MAWTEKLPSGRYRGSYRDPSGKSRSAGTFTQAREALKKATLAEAESRSLGWRDPAAGSRPWGDWAAAWWPTRAVEAGTLKRDESRLQRHLMPRWGHVPIAQISRHDVKAWVTELGATLAPASVQRILYLFSSSFTAAIDAELVATNPAYRIRIAHGETSLERFLTLDEFAALDEQLLTTYDRALASLLVGTGARWGEGVGIHLHRLDLRRGTLRIAEVWDDAMRRVKPYPKGRKIRAVPVPDWVLEIVDPLVDGRTRGLLFDTGAGRPVDISNWRRRTFDPALERAKLGHVRIHDLRHTYASWLLQDGVSLAEVGRLMGHVSPVTTQRYAHLAPTDQTRVLKALPNPTRGAAVEQGSATPDYAPLVSIAPRTAGSQGS